MKDKEFESMVKDKAKGVLKSYTTVNPKKIANNFYETATNTIQAPIETARSNIRLFNRLRGNSDKKLSYEELYRLKGADENTRQSNYTNFSIAALILFVFMIGVAAMGVIKVNEAIDSTGKLMAIMSYGSGTLLAFSVYFRVVVRTYGLKYATVDNKLNVFKRIGDMLPNPLLDIRASTNSEDKPIVAFLETKEDQERNK